MKNRILQTAAQAAGVILLVSTSAFAQMGRTWPSEKKVVQDPVTGLPLTFLTSTDGGYRQSKIYQTHRQWTVDGKWLIFRGTRETGSQAFAVNSPSVFNSANCASSLASASEPGRKPSPSEKLTSCFWKILQMSSNRS